MNDTSSAGMTALAYATQYGHCQIVATLIKAGATFGFDDVRVAIKMGHLKDVLKVDTLKDIFLTLLPHYQQDEKDVKKDVKPRRPG